jgi:hypothetical protein
VRRSLVRCDRGAMFVEALVVIPLLVTLWVILLFLERGNTVANETVERSRHCAWRHAVNECRGGVGGCALTPATEIDGSEVDGMSGGALSTIGGRLPFLAGETSRAHGKVFRATTHAGLSRPFGWGSVMVTSRQRWMCQTPKRPWRDFIVHDSTCRAKGLPWCSESAAMPGTPPAATIRVPLGVRRSLPEVMR